MKIEALGMIEIKGYLGAIAAADASLKTADIILINAEKIKGGQTTIQFVGDVAAVQVAVDSGTAIAKDLGCLISSHMIPRISEEIAIMITDNIHRKNDLEESNQKINTDNKKTSKSKVVDNIDANDESNTNVEVDDKKKKKKSQKNNT